jgi:hypothetical protein
LHIRDKQRRSRARQKEYLEELKEKLRKYELEGIKASVEIQNAARQVAVENRKLRELLLIQGIGYDSIENYLESTPQR